MFNKAIVSIEQRRAYDEGYNAQDRADVEAKDILCPYPIGYGVSGLRQCWYNGLYDNKFSKYDHIPMSTDNATNKQTKKKYK